MLAVRAVRGGPTSSGAKRIAAASGLAAVLESDDLDRLAELQQQLDEVMEECARRAEEVVNGRRLGGRSPREEDCGRVVGEDDKGQKIRWRRVLGKEKHEEAQKCVAQMLGEKWVGFFSVEQRYRYDPESGHIEPLSRQEVKALLAQGRSGELVGSLEPDLVFHTGNLTRVKFLYDFKFPCPPDNPPTWNIYRGDHPYRDSTQGEMYERAFGVQPARVSPKHGVIRR